MRYCQHFGLERPLFRTATPTQPLYMSQAHREALAALEWSLCFEPSRVTLLTGDRGTGKTTLLGSLLARDYYQIRTAVISNPTSPFDHLLRAVLHQFGIGAGPSKLELRDAFDSFLATIEPGGRVVIIVDDAHALSDTDLGELALLAETDALDENQLHFILVGHTELTQRLLTPSLVRLDARIGARATLAALSRAESFEYLEYCLRSGGGNARKAFRRRALACVVDHGGGVPRRLNVLCHNAMMLAYSAGRPKVAPQDARSAVAEYANLFLSESPVPEPSPIKPRPPWYSRLALSRSRVADLTRRPALDATGAAPTGP